MGTPDARPGLRIPVRYQVLAAAGSVALVTYIHRVGFSQTLPYIRKEFQLDADQVGLLGFAFLLSYGGFEIPGGVLSDRFGVRHVLTTLVLGWSVVTAGFACAGLLPVEGQAAFLFLLALRFAFGIFQAGGFPALSRMMADWMPVKERATAQGIIWMSSRAGAMLVPILILTLINLVGDWKLVLALLAGVGLVWCLGFWPWFRNRPEEMAGVTEEELDLIEAGRAPQAGHAHIPWEAILRCRSVWALALMYGCGGFAANFYVTLLPTYLTDYRGISKTDLTWITTAPFVCGVVACLLGGALSDGIIRATGSRKWGRRLNGTIGTVVAAVGWLALPHAASPVAIAAILCLIFFFNDIAMGPAWASCADVGERYAGTIGGTMNMIGNLAGAIGNLVAGLLFERTVQLPFLDQPIEGKQLLFVIYACSFLCGTLCWQGVDVTKPVRVAEEA